MVVNPACSVAYALAAAASVDCAGVSPSVAVWSRFWRLKYHTGWVCASIKPGRTVRSPKSTSRAPAGTALRVVMLAMRFLTTRMSMLCHAPPRPSRTIAARRTTRVVAVSWAERGGAMARKANKTARRARSPCIN